MTKYAKKREYIEAVRWTGEVTPEITAILGDLKIAIDEGRKTSFGPGWMAEVGDWIVGHGGERVGVVSHKVFELVYEPVDVDASAQRPTDDEHEANAREFVAAVDAVLIDGLRLSPETHPSIFCARDDLRYKLRTLLEDQSWRSVVAERQRIKDRIAKDIL